MKTIRRTVIINATNIGQRFDGIGVYTLSLLRELSKIDSGLYFIVFVNKSCRIHLKNITFSKNISIRWTTRYLSPDYGFRGHFLRLLYSNLLSLKFRNNLIFITSQLEALFFRSNQIITIHDVIPLLFEKQHKKLHLFYRYLLKSALSRAKHIITPSAYTKDSLIFFYHLPLDKLHVIPNGIQNIYFEKGEESGNPREKLILYAGRIADTKNIDGLLKAFKLLYEKIDHTLIIAGEGKNFDRAEERVIFKGYVSNEQLLDLYKRASLFVFPSFCEGFGFPPLEAMACGCPVVAANIASLSENCGEAAYYVNPYDAVDIAEGIYRVLTAENLRAGLIKKGRERAKMFTWEKSAQELIKVMREALNA